MAYVIAEPCVDVMDKACVAECPVDCIYEGGRKLYIHPDECIDCSACEPVCPVDAIFYAPDLPERWAEYSTANIEFFADLESPGGAAEVGVLARDAACVCAVAPRTTPIPRREPPPPVWRTLARMARRQWNR